MNQNLPQFYCLEMITSIMIFIISIDATSLFVWSTQCKFFGMNIFKIGVCLIITNKSMI